MTTINAQTIINEVMLAHAVAPLKSSIPTIKIEKKIRGVYKFGALVPGTDIEIINGYAIEHHVKFRTSDRGFHSVLNCSENLQRFADLVRKNARFFGGGLIKEAKPRAAVSWPASLISLFKQSIEDADYLAALDLGDKLGALFYVCGNGQAYMQVAPIPCETMPGFSSVMSELGHFSLIEPVSMRQMTGSMKRSRSAQIALCQEQYDRATPESKARILSDAESMRADQSAIRAQWCAEHGLPCEAVETPEIEEPASLGDRFEAELAKRKATREAQAAQDVAQVVAQAVAAVAISEAMQPSEAQESRELVTCEAGESEAQSPSMGSTTGPTWAPVPQYVPPCLSQIKPGEPVPPAFQGDDGQDSEKTPPPPPVAISSEYDRLEVDDIKANLLSGGYIEPARLIWYFSTALGLGTTELIDGFISAGYRTISKIDGYWRLSKHGVDGSSLKLGKSKTEWSTAYATKSLNHREVVAPVEIVTPTPPAVESANTSHLSAICARLEREESRLANTTTDNDRVYRQLQVTQAKKELAGEYAFLGMAPAAVATAEEEDALLAELMAPTEPAETQGVEGVARPNLESDDDKRKQWQGFACDIPASLARSAFNGVSMSPERRGASAQNEYGQTMAADYETMHAQAVKGGTLDLLPEVFARYNARQGSAFRAYLSSSSRCVSSFIAGPSNFPVARMNKRSEIAHKRLTEYLDGGEMALRSAIRKLRPDLRAIMSGDADAVDRLTVELSGAERRQAGMKAANKAIRENSKAGEAHQVAALMELGHSEAQALELLHPRFTRGQGFPSFSLTNNQANIRRMRARLEKITAAKACEVVAVECSNGVTLEDDAPANRVRLFFPGKPSEEIRNDLKSSGFRWAPSIGAWQAYRNNGTISTAKRLAGDVVQDAPASPDENQGGMGGLPVQIENDSPEVEAMPTVVESVEVSTPGVAEFLPKDARVSYAKIKRGTAFTFELNGPVFVKSSNGFRPGRGGELFAAHGEMMVYEFSLDPVQATTSATTETQQAQDVTTVNPPEAPTATQATEPSEEAARPTVQSKSGKWCAWLFINSGFGMLFEIVGGEVIESNHGTASERMAELTRLARLADFVPPNPPEKTEGWEGSPVQISTPEAAPLHPRNIVPENGLHIVDNAFEAWTFTQKTRFGFVMYLGKSTKPWKYFGYPTAEKRNEGFERHAADARTILAAKNARKLADKAQADKPHGLIVGDVVRSSWGYEQTNINHYQITAVIGKRTVEVRELAEHEESTGDMSGRVAPVHGEFVGDAKRCTVDKWGQVNVRGKDYGRASKIEPLAIIHGVRCYAASHYSDYA